MQLTNIDEQYGNDYQAYNNDGIEYRLYDADPDQDGLHSSLELLLGTDPVSHDSAENRRLTVTQTDQSIRISFPKVPSLWSSSTRNWLVLACS